MNISDIAFIGSGAASTITLVELFKKLNDRPAPEKKLTITVIDKYPEFWTGIPYGSRSSVNSLIITPVTDFIQEKTEQTLFFNWIISNLDELTNYYSVKGGNAASNWLNEKLPFIKSGEWEKVHIPRFIFGFYLENKLQGLLKEAKEKQLVEVTLIHGEAVDIEKTGDGLYTIVLEDNDKHHLVKVAKKLVIATGSAPVKKYLKEANNNLYSYINDIYEPALDENIKALAKALSNTSDVEERNVLIIGTNASSIELLYLLNYLPDINTKINRIVAISTRGSMPYHIDQAELNNYPCPHLDTLKVSGGYDIRTLVKAAKKDIEQTILNGVINVPYTARVIGYTLELMQTLDEDSQKMFYGTYGMQLTKLIRRSGPAYKGATAAFIQAQKLELLKGEFLNITNGVNGCQLNYADPATKELHTFDLPFKVVINCTGSDNLDVSASRLLYNLVHKNICKENLSGKGFIVNENFEAAPNLYVIGPLLGGNMNKRIYTWHLENVAKLFYYAPFLVDCLLGE